MRDPITKLWEKVLKDEPGTFRARKYSAVCKAAILFFIAGYYAGAS